MGDNAGFFFLALIYIAIVMVLVRPGSSGPAFITAVSKGMVNLVNAATGGGSFSGSSSGTSSVSSTGTSAPAPVQPLNSQGTILPVTTSSGSAGVQAV